ncbi:hypothetical protein Dimus_038937 [Dionaea muscipula]
MVNSPSDVAVAFTLFYENLLGSSSAVHNFDTRIAADGPLVSPSIAHALCRPVEPQEIKDALWSIGDDNVPGPDGYTAKFYKSSWDMVGRLAHPLLRLLCLEIVMRLAEDFFANGGPLSCSEDIFLLQWEGGEKGNCPGLF